MRPSFVFILLGTLLSGCVSDAENTRPPVLSASVDSMQATVGSSVAFTINATDVDGDPLTWILTLDDEIVADGAELPARYVHTFGAKGSFLFTLRVSDGLFEVNQTFAIDVAEPEPGFTLAGLQTVPVNPLIGGIPFVSNGGGTGALACNGFLVGENEVDCVFGEVPAGLDGQPWTSDENTSLEWWDTCSPTGSATASYTHDHEGTVPAGTGCVVMFFWGSGTADLRVDIF